MSELQSTGRSTDMHREEKAHLPVDRRSGRADFGPDLELNSGFLLLPINRGMGSFLGFKSQN